MTRKNNDAPMAVCPHCGEMIKRDAAVCPHCGSDERTGWSEWTYLNGIELPGDEGYDEMLAREFEGKTRFKPRWHTWMALIGAMVLAAFLLGYLQMLC